MFDLYAVAGIGSGAETLFLSETNIDQSNGVFVDFSDGVQGELQSAWVTSFGGNGGSVGFSINNFEKIELTDFADYVLVTEDVGDGVGQFKNSAYLFFYKSIRNVN